MPVEPTSALYERRLDAARVSKGTSKSAVYRMLLAAASEVLKPGAHLLEFGAGTGQLITMLREEGFRGPITGADILPKPESPGLDVNWIEADLNEPLPAAGATFDAIISTEVIEHLENPRAVFREFRRLLKAGGFILVTTPNQESVRSLLSLFVRGHYVDFLDSSYPAHITALVRTDFVRMCAENGFEPPRFRYSNTGSIPAAPHLSWQQLSAGLLKGRRFSDNLAMISRKVD
ncbi:MAG: methyltransferase domain-containing protein [Vicinamibacterales bacterium]|nr:methyltransferase domain-containing protein [Vicinamibacterales bacterium]